MSVSTSLNPRHVERFVFVRRRPSLCGDRFDSQIFSPFVSGTRSKPLTTQTHGDGKCFPDKLLDSCSATFGGHGELDDRKDFSTVLTHVCPLVPERREGSVWSESSSSTVACPGEYSTNEHGCFTDASSDVMSPNARTSIASDRRYLTPPVLMGLWRVIIAVLAIAGYLARIYHVNVIPAYNLFSNTTLFPAFPAFPSFPPLVALPSFATASDKLLPHLCTSAVLPFGVFGLCSQPKIMNFASFDLGARPIENITSLSPGPRTETLLGVRSSAVYSAWSRITGKKKTVSYDSSIVLRNSPSDLAYGHCWPLTAETGRFAVSLPQPIYITNITVSHFLSPSRAENLGAPRNIVFLGAALISELGDEGRSLVASTRLDARSALRDELVHLLKPGQDLLPIGKMVYSIDGDTTQWLSPQESSLWSKVKVSSVVLKIESNWGSQKTCLHNMQVFGHT